MRGLDAYVPNGADCCQIAWDAWRQILAVELPFSRTAWRGMLVAWKVDVGRLIGQPGRCDYRSDIGSVVAWLHHKHIRSSPTRRM